jgi:ATP-binding cassette subfamily G (WHITE) protein 2 (SNQ2)
VCVIYEGKMAYMGDAREARNYFTNMGYEPANRQTTADFLVAGQPPRSARATLAHTWLVTDPHGRIRRRGVVGPLPSTAAEFAAHFKRSASGRANQEDVATYRQEHTGKPERASAYVQSTRAERAQHTRRASPYTISLPMQARAVMVRRLQILKGSATTQLIQTAYVHALETGS